MKSVAIIGGGITGLTCGFRLAGANIPVTLYEASDRVGGVIKSYRRDGYLAEYGPNSILETSPKIAALIRDAGLETRKIYSDPGAEKRFIVRRGKPVQLPGSPVGFFRTELFSAKAKLRLMMEPLVRKSDPAVEESLADFVLRRIGREFLDYAINPFVAGVYAGDPRRLSVKEAFPKLHQIEQRYGSLILGQILGARERKKRAEVSKQNAKKVSFDEGLEVLTETLRERLGPSIRLGNPVSRLEQRADGWSVTAGGQTAEHSAVLFALPAHDFAKFEVKAARPISLERFSRIHYPPVASVVLGFRREDVAHPLDGFGMLIPEIEGFKILGSLFSSSLFPNRAPKGHVTLTSYVGGTRNPELALLEEQKLIETTVQDLRQILGVRGQPTFRHTCVYPHAIPQYEVGYGKFREQMSEIERQAPGLFMAGHYREGISLGDSLVSGDNVAGRIQSYLEKASVAGPELAATGTS